MLSHANLPNKLWAEAVATTVYLRNRTIMSANEEQFTPFEKWHGHISHLKVFGCAAYSHIHSTESTKLDKKAQRMCSIGCSKTRKGYRLIDLSTDKVITYKDVVFNDTDVRCFKRASDESVSFSPEVADESEEKIVGCETSTRRACHEINGRPAFPVKVVPPSHGWSPKSMRIIKPTLFD